MTASIATMRIRRVIRNLGLPPANTSATAQRTAADAQRTNSWTPKDSDAADDKRSNPTRSTRIKGGVVASQANN
jgi:hypothetical protein